MCIDVINAAVEAMPEPEPDGEDAEHDADFAEVMARQPAEPGPEPERPVRTVRLPGTLGGDDDAGAATAHENRVRHVLAHRPDGAATSEAVAPWPEHQDSEAAD
jgi:hypothetical protein